jgi:hypothetical protein
MLKTIPLTPFPTELDVWVGGKELIPQIVKRYGKGIEHDVGQAFDDNDAFCSHTVTDTDSELKGSDKIFCVYSRFSPDIVVHESLHVVHYLKDLYRAELEAEEWCAYMLQYIFNQTLNISNE